MSKKLFVGGLAWATTDDGLRRAFERFGPVVEAKVVMDRDTGRSRGFGSVNVTKPADSKAALAELDGTQLDGRMIRVDAAKERSRGGPRRDRW